MQTFGVDDGMNLIEGISERGYPMLFALIKSFSVATDATKEQVWALVNEFCLSYLELADPRYKSAQDAYTDFRAAIDEAGIKLATLAAIEAVVEMRDMKVAFLNSQKKENQEK